LDYFEKLRKNDDTEEIIAKNNVIAAFQALYYIEEKLLAAGQSLADQLLESEEYVQWKSDHMEELTKIAREKLWQAELKYDCEEESEKAEEAESTLNEAQLNVYNAVLEMVEAAEVNDFKESSMIFLDAPGGTGKTYLIHGLCSTLRSRKKVVVPVASTGIAAQLLPGGRTAHSKFKIPIPIRKTCSMSGHVDDPLGVLFRKTSLIIVDEATMLHRDAYEAVDQSLQDIKRRSKVAFGGIPVLFCGDFRQTLPVVKHEGRIGTMEASLERSHLWEEIRVMHLTENMRVKFRMLETSSDVKQLQEYNDFLLRVGDNLEETYVLRGPDVIKLPESIVSKANTDEDFIDEIFPDIVENFKKSSYLGERSILTPLNKYVNRINKTVLDRCPGIEKIYYSADTITEDNPDLKFAMQVEYLNTLCPTGLPPHALHLKVGAPVMLIRNLGGHEGACNGAKLIVTRIEENSVWTIFANGTYKGESLTLMRIPLCPSESSGVSLDSVTISDSPFFCDDN
jgi:ATP-dependent DNA helicase PIF1